MAQPENFWSFKIGDLITIAVLVLTMFAIVYGPIKAVEIARKREDARDDEKRKRQIFTKFTVAAGDGVSVTISSLKMASESIKSLR